MNSKELEYCHSLLDYLLSKSKDINDKATKDKEKFVKIRLTNKKSPV